MTLDSFQFQAGLDVWYFSIHGLDTHMDLSGRLIYIPPRLAWSDTTEKERPT